MNHYNKSFDGDVPCELEGQKDYVFSTFPDITKFHEAYVKRHCTK